MSVLERFGAWLRGQRSRTSVIRVHVILKGRIGKGWYDVDEQLARPAGATLGQLIERAEQRGIALARALEDSPHLRHTLMWNGQRAPVDDAGNQRYFRTDDGQRDVFLGEISQLFQGQYVDGYVLALGFDGGAGIARCDKHFLHTRILSHFPGQGVFAATAANDQNIHFKNLG